MFRIIDTPLKPSELQEQCRNPKSGAFTSFEGWIRDHNDGKEVLRLEYESYKELAEKEGNRIINEAIETFGIHSAYCDHRVGKLEIGGIAVWVGVNAAHRGEAFDACRYIIDNVKKRVPIWKNEHYTDGSTEWVVCTHHSH
ncbi:MAG: molybdenum cofactor biosynthesis protein MoaE [Fibrobacterales bacterium]